MLAVVEFTMSGYDHLYAFVVDHISRLIYINDLTVGKSLREFKAGNSIEEETFSNGLLEYPQYTRPEIFLGKKVPDVLLSGHHKNIKKWREQVSLEITKNKRPDLLKKEGGYQ